MKSSRVLWFAAIGWILFYAITFLAVTLAIYLKNEELLMILDQRSLNIITSVTFIYSVWLLISICTALQAYRSKKRGFMFIFLAQVFISLIFELSFLIYVLIYQEAFLMKIFTMIIGGLVNNYTNSNVSKSYTDWINMKFQCCGLTQWHREWWVDDSGFIKNEYKFAWVPDSCCLENSRYSRCGIALPPPKPDVTEEDKSATDIRQFYYESGYLAATYWYMRLNNEPCPDMMIEYLGEEPTYLLMACITLSFARFAACLGTSIVFVGKLRNTYS